jgi:hypothetical protein
MSAWEKHLPAARILHAEGRDWETVLRFLRRRGLDRLGSMRVVMEIEHLSLNDSKVLVFNSRAWADRLQDLHDIEEAFDEMEREDAAKGNDGKDPGKSER